MTADEARAYLSSISGHRDRRGDTAFLHPDFAIRLATAIQQARAVGIQAGLGSGYREGTVTGSAYDMKGDSSHAYGLAGDVSGIGAPGSATAMRWKTIAEANGLNNPYGIDSPTEWNHWQVGPKLENDTPLYTALNQGKATGDPAKMWAAYTPGAGGASTGSSTVASGPDNRQIFFDALKSAGLNSQQALGVLWSIGGESHPNIDTTAVNPNDPGGAFGALQWIKDRRWPLEEIARHRGVAATDPHLQAEYMKGELTGDLQGAQFQPGVLDALKQAKTPEEAARIWTAKMERPAVDNSEARIANGAAVGSLDANGNFVPGSAKAAPAVASASGAKAAPAAGAPAAPAAPPSPLATLGSALASAFDDTGSALGGRYSSGSSGYADPPDQPAIRSMAAMTDFTAPPANPVPQSLSQGVGPTLGSLAIQPQVEPFDASITQGAPSMTAMLGQVGTSYDPTQIDPRRTGAINPYQRFPRLA